MMISADEYHRRKKRDREVLSIQDFTDAEIEAVRLAEPSKEAEAFNQEFSAWSVVNNIFGRWSIIFKDASQL